MSHPLVEKILSGDVAAQVRLAGARGVLPISREDQIELWSYLRNDPDPDVRLAARENLVGVPASEWRVLLREYAFRKEVFEFASRTLSRQEELASALLQNKSLPDADFAYLAGVLRGGQLEQIIDSQTRLIRYPEAVIALLSNPSIGASQARRLFDLAEQFFRDHSRIPAIFEEKFGLKVGHAGGAFSAEPAPKPAEAAPLAHVVPTPTVAPHKVPPSSTPAVEEPIHEAGEEVAEETTGTEALGEAAELEDEGHKTLYQRLLTMSVPQKIGLAFNGDKEARSLLIRDSNKVVQEAVLNSPKLTDGEVESICKMRNLSEEILRKIARNGEWMKTYSIMKALVSNPKTPPGVVLPMVIRLNDFDLKQTIKDKNVSEVVRREAKKVFEIRHTPKKTSFKKH